MRKKLFAGNWKMNLTAPEARALAGAIRQNLGREEAELAREREVMIAPAAINIPAVANELIGSWIGLGAQNMHFEDHGAFTGEISPPMLKAFGVVYAMVGHSERRHLFGESDQLVNRKLRAALAHGMTPVLCVGETAEQRDAGETSGVVLGQLERGLEGVSAAEANRIVLAYEPVWAIGTGRNASPADAQMVHGAIRAALGERYRGPVAHEIRILYGGSVTPGNVDSLVAQPDIDGVLVGGASLQAESFARIVRAGKR